MRRVRSLLKLSFLGLGLSSIAVAGGLDLNLNDTYRLSDIDVNLGGINFRGEYISPDYMKYSNSPYLDTIWASKLFEILEQRKPELATSPQKPSLEKIAETFGMEPASDFIKERYNDALASYTKAKSEYPGKVSKQFNQLFVLKTIGNMLDEEGYLMKQKVDVPLERIDYAVREVLLFENEKFTDAILGDYVKSLIDAAIKKGGADAALDLDKIGIPHDIVFLFTRRLPKDKKPAAVFAAFKKQFDADVIAMIQNKDHVPPKDANVPPYKDLSPSLLARYAELMVPLVRGKMDEQLLFDRLKARVGKDPYFFTVGWGADGEAGNDEILKSLVERFSGENWKPLILAGQSPEDFARDIFPDTLEQFYRYVEKNCMPLQRTIIRQRVANAWTFKFWRNRNLLNPEMAKGNLFKARRSMEMFNPFDPIRMNMTADELDETYQEIKFDRAAVPTPEFVITEIKLGDAQDVGTTPGVVSKCAGVFNRAFQVPYGDLQKQTRVSLDSDQLTTRKFDELISQARESIPQRSYEVALAAMRADSSCADYSVTIAEKVVSMESNAPAGSEEQAKQKFIMLMMSNKQMQGMLVPKFTRRDRPGNGYHYFFKRRKVLYVPRSEETPVSPELFNAFVKAAKSEAPLAPFTDAGFEARARTMLRKATQEVGYAVRDTIVGRRFADRMAEAVADVIGRRFIVKVRTEPFSYNGVDGLQLLRDLGDPQSWIPQIFVVPRPQLQPELLTERNLIERSISQFEQAYDLP